MDVSTCIFKVECDKIKMRWYGQMIKSKKTKSSSFYVSSFGVKQIFPIPMALRKCNAGLRSFLCKMHGPVLILMLSDFNLLCVKLQN